MDKGEIIDYGCGSKHVVRAKVMEDGDVPVKIKCPACGRMSVMMGGKAESYRKLISARAMMIQPEWEAGVQIDRLVIAPVQYLEMKDYRRVISMNLPGDL